MANRSRHPQRLREALFAMARPPARLQTRCVTKDGGGCYYWQGQTQGAHHSMRIRSLDYPMQYTLSYALDHAVRTARYIRAAVGGDPNVFDRPTVQSWHDKAKAAGFKGMLIYTHFFNTKGSHLKGLAMASCDELAQADAAVNAGWRAAVTITSHKAPGANKPQLRNKPEWTGQQYTTPEGREVVLCPAQIGKRNCNTCGLCNATTDFSRRTNQARRDQTTHPIDPGSTQGRRSRPCVFHSHTRVDRSHQLSGASFLMYKMTDYIMTTIWILVLWNGCVWMIR